MEILGYAVLGLMLASWFQPLQWFKDDILKLHSIPYIGYAFYCVKCVTFWTTLIITHDLLFAFATSYIAFCLSHIVDRINNYYM
jgi:hypothetical protein